MPALDRDGTKLFYEESGAGDPPFVFVHGWCCDHSFFDPQAEHFGRTRRVVSVDLRGHGASDAPEAGYTIPELADDVAWLCRELGVAGAVVVGHSMGGTIAVELASAHPELVSAVAMVDPAPVVPSHELRALFAGFVDTLPGPGRETQRRFVESMFAPTDDPTRKQQIVEGMCRVPEHVARNAIAGIAAWDGAAALGAVEVPVLSIGSAAPVNDPARLQEVCAHVVIGQTVGSGHFNQLEVPDQVNAMIEQFLRVSGIRS